MSWGKVTGFVTCQGGSFCIGPYPTHSDYVAAAADAALAKGWILPEDRDAYVTQADSCPVGGSNELTREQLKACIVVPSGF